MHQTRQIKSFYTDGACSGNPGPGGWGTVVYFTDGSVYEMGGAEAQTTNNRMEMQGAIQALKMLKACSQKEPVTLYTDSEYLKNGITKWIKGWKKKGWQTAQGKPVLNQDLWEILDELNLPQVDWQYVRGHNGDRGNERADRIARTFASGKPPALNQTPGIETPQTLKEIINSPVTGVADSRQSSELTYKSVPLSLATSDLTMIDSTDSSYIGAMEELPREVRVDQLRNLVETLRITDEIATKGYLISSSELADLMDVNASAVTSRGDNWHWRNWIVSRVRREGNQILWQLERVDQVNATDQE
ncbi:ribonuclease HI [Limnofasciculus baicalensis]|uniref:Ribonuclease H n=1 Tax=Limnofasciculus baicalensis BBK-W-15 TaxID=2699891 RepID=A0AAE3GXL8_9CYAN|nr:ribonuclease HI [Limnofasciculus baicalensis]MCP2732414.1 ribonuclease HI [Limnofasciculus baicalensis BBK-W-15]